MTIKEDWDSYQTAIIPPNAPLNQRVETLRAFMAGCASMFKLMMDAAEGDEADAEVKLTALESELKTYASRVGQVDELPPLPPDVEAAYEIKDDHIQKRLRLLGDQIHKGLPKGWGFTLFLFTLGEGGSMFYLSSAERESMLEALHEFIARQIERKRAN